MLVMAVFGAGLVAITWRRGSHALVVYPLWLKSTKTQLIRSKLEMPLHLKLKEAWRALQSATVDIVVRLLGKLFRRDGF